MAWLQLQSIESLFDSSYGYILVIKLCVIAPMIALDAYHQFRLHYAMIQIAQMKESGSQEQFGSTSDIFEKRTSHINLVDQYDPFKRFSKTIKIESLIGISVLVVSSFLTITSPPSMVHSDSQMEMEMEEPESINSINDDSDMNQILPRITDSNGDPATNIRTVFWIFNNEQAGLGPISTELSKVEEGIYSGSGGFLSQPGVWEVEITAQRGDAYDLNHSFDIDIRNAST